MYTSNTKKKKLSKTKVILNWNEKKYKWLNQAEIEGLVHWKLFIKKKKIGVKNNQNKSNPFKNSNVLLFLYLLKFTKSFIEGSKYKIVENINNM